MKDTPSLSAEAERLLETMQLLPPREPGDRLRTTDEATILELSAAGKSQAEIAEVVGCHQSTVSRVLAEWSDTRGAARKYAEAKSLEMMKRFVAQATPAEILKMQQKLDVIRDDKVDVSGNQFIVAIGRPGHVSPELEPPDISAYVRPSGEPIRQEDVMRATSVVMIGVAPPGTPLNPLPVGHGTTDDAA